MEIKIHPSIIIRGSLTLILISVLVSVLFIRPFLEKNSKPIRQVDLGSSPDKDITPIDPKYHKALTANHRLFVILISSNDTLGRVIPLMNTWGSAFKETRFSAGLFFEFLENRNKTFQPYKNIPYFDKYKNMMKSFADKPNKKDYELAIKEINALDYYVSNTKVEWFFRGVDDTYVNMNEFPRFFTSLADPTGKKLLYGDCIYDDTPYLHGGSGILMSREMAKTLLKHSEEWLKNIEGPEQVYFSKLVQSAGFNVTDFCSPHFIGLFNKKTRNFDELPKCDKIRDFYPANKFYDSAFEIKKTIFFHDKFHRMTMDDWTKLVEEGPDDLKWVHGRNQEFLCF